MPKEEIPNFDTFEELSTVVGELWNEGRPQRAIEILEQTKGRFPDRRYDMIFSLGYSYLLVGRYDEALSVLEEGLSRGFWFVFPLDTPVIRPLVNRPRFQRIVAESERMKQEAQAQCSARLDVAVPEACAGGDPCPLFLALHGWGGNNETFAQYWTSGLLRERLLSAFLESSQLVKMDGGRGWDDLDLGRREIARLYDDILRRHSVDESRVLVGGFSQGGRMAIDLAINGILPVAGFVVLCPGGGIPDSFTARTLEAARDRGLCGTIITGEHDPDLPDQETMMQMFKDAGLDCRMTVRAGLGHWFPEDFGEQLDQAIRHVLGE